MGSVLPRLQTDQQAAPTLTTLELQYVSPRLLAARELELCVPGNYSPAARRLGDHRRLAPTMHVITSKQRPRRLQIHGSDGKDHGYLLKGHEDLRQDERVMQLFGLVNMPSTHAKHGDARSRHRAIRGGTAVAQLGPHRLGSQLRHPPRAHSRAQGRA